MKMTFISALFLTLALFSTGCSDLGLDDDNATSDGVTDPYQNTIAYTLSSAVEDSVNVTKDNDEDVFKLELTKTGTYTAYIEILKGTLTSFAGTVYMEVYDQEGIEISRAIASAESGKWNRLTFDANKASSYYIRIYRTGEEDTKYEFSAYPSMKNGYVQDSNREHNDVKEMATPITLIEASAEINGSVNITGLKDSDDWYKLPLTKTGTYTVHFEVLKGTSEHEIFNPYLYIFSEDGTKLNYISPFGTEGSWENVTFEANLAENYYIQVQRSHNMQTNYAFSVSITP